VIDFKTISCQSPSNIALIKYWGKHGNQLPNNPSLSMTLQKAFTSTKMHYRLSNSGMKLEYFFEGKQNAMFQETVFQFMKKVTEYLPFIHQFEFRFESENSFPHSTGIASSASSMSALAFCFVSMEKKLNGETIFDEAFYQRVSQIARLGSGSASRSVYKGWVSWGFSDIIPGSSDEFASPLTIPVHEKFQKMGDAILIVSGEKKKVSSTIGHGLMNDHPFADGRYRQAKGHFSQLIEVLQTGQFDQFASIVEAEALSLHSLLMTSSPNGLLLKPNSLVLIQSIRDFRKESGTEVCFTLDAGPNIHLLYPLQEREKVINFVENELIPFCENGQWIDDEMAFSK
jgi:diphosphomevalonate decarboxylase